MAGLGIEQIAGLLGLLAVLVLAFIALAGYYLRQLEQECADLTRRLERLGREYSDLELSYRELAASSELTRAGYQNAQAKLSRIGGTR